MMNSRLTCFRSMNFVMWACSAPFIWVMSMVSAKSLGSGLTR